MPVSQMKTLSCRKGKPFAHDYLFLAFSPAQALCSILCHSTPVWVYQVSGPCTMHSYSSVCLYISPPPSCSPLPPLVCPSLTSPFSPVVLLSSLQLEITWTESHFPHFLLESITTESPLHFCICYVTDLFVQMSVVLFESFPTWGIGNHRCSSLFSLPIPVPDIY